MVKLIDILNEIGDATSKKYNWKEVYNNGWINEPDGESEYEFKTDSGIEYGVQIRNIGKYLDVDFVADGSYDEVNKGEVFSVMATIVDIIKSIVDKGGIKGIRYIAKSKGNDAGIARDRLYRIYISKLYPNVTFLQQGGTIFATFK